MGKNRARARAPVYIPTLRDRVAYWICGFANGGVEACTCQKSRSRCCERSEGIAKTVIGIIRDHEDTPDV